ncbi:MAG TPA: hypothetical protein VF521_16280, partial [Pyrinomonadaceae bacterium]
MRTRSKSERLLTRSTLLFVILLSLTPPALADQLKLADGTTMEVDEAWEDAQGVWYRRGGVTNLIDKARVREVVKGEVKAAGGESVVKPAVVERPKVEEAQAVWIYLVGGAKMEVDEASEGADGVWFKRGNISTFIERARVERVERERVEEADVADAAPGKRRERRWTTGNGR